MPYLNITEVESALAVASSPPYNAFTQLITLPNVSWEGRVAHAVRIGNGASPGKPGLCFLGGVHSREWGSPDILVYFIEQLQQAYVGGTGITLGGKVFSAAQIQSIVNTLDLYVFPQVNPDGRNYSLTVDGMWRKNRRPAPPASPACLGVDINRNYDFLWNFPVYFNPASGVRNSTNACDEIYIGPAAFSEPETQNVLWMMDTRPGIRFLLDLHSFSESILYVWGDDDDQNTDPNMNFQNPAYNSQRGIASDTAYREYIPSCDQAAVEALGNRMQSAIQAVRGRVYTVGQALSLYPTAGTGHDYSFSRQLVNRSKSKVYGYTIEWGQEFHPPYDEMQNIVQEVTAGLLEFCLAAIDTNADVYVKDNIDDSGVVPYGGVFWDNSDIFTRQSDDDVLIYQPPKRSQTNYIYVQVTNRGPADATNVQVNVRAVRYPGTEFVYPQDWTLIDADHVKPDVIADSWASIPAGAARVAKFSFSAAQVETLYGWQAASWHPCVLAEVVGCNDYSTAVGVHVWDNNNLAQRNITITEATQDSLVVFPFVAGNRFRREGALELVIDRANLPKNFELFLDAVGRFPAAGSPGSDFSATLLESTRMAVTYAGFEGAITVPAGATFESHRNISEDLLQAEGASLWQDGGKPVLKVHNSIASVRLYQRAGGAHSMILRVRVPPNAQKGSVHFIRVLQRGAGSWLAGGVTLELRIV